MRLIVGAGGTGGHVVPALAVAEALKKKVLAEVVFVGAGRGVEEKLVSRAGYRLVRGPVVGLPRRFSPELLRFGMGLVRGLVLCRDVFLEFRPDAAFCTGGYAAFPVGVLALCFRVPLYLHESNRVLGLVNRVLSFWARRVYTGFKGVGPRVRRVHTGNPVRGGVGRASREEGRRRFGLGDGPVVLAFGGSQGARAINRAVGEALGRWVEAGVEVIWQVGEGDLAWASELSEAYRGKVKVFSFIEDMAYALAAVDLAVCRAGAMTISELTASALPAILVPLPSSAGGHQLYNALALQEAGAAVVLEERELTGKRLMEEVLGLLEDRRRLEAMRRASARLGVRDAAERVAGGMLEDLRSQGKMQIEN